MTLTRRDSTGNSTKHYQAATQVFSTARNVFPWTRNLLLPVAVDAEVPYSPTTTPETGTSATVDHSLQERFVAFDVLRGRDVLVKAKDCGFTIFKICDQVGELEELCGYTCSSRVIRVKVNKSTMQLIIDYPYGRCRKSPESCTYLCETGKA